MPGIDDDPPMANGVNDNDNDFSSDDSDSVEHNDQQDMGFMHDLDAQEVEKLVQFQDMTGIDDLGICRALLESKNWDLEATAREHLNLPPPNPR